MPMGIDVSFHTKPVQEMLESRGLEPGGKIQRYMAAQLVGMFDGYVPLRSGILKGSATRNLAAPYDTITYDGPYARRLYYNPGYNFNEAPRRGAFWDKRAWADNSGTFLQNLERIINAGRFDP